MSCRKDGHYFVHIKLGLKQCLVCYRLEEGTWGLLEAGV